MDPQDNSSATSADISAPPKPTKPPVVRGARACTVCRAAKMKCVGSDDGQQPCMRCRRSNTECIFEKHRRGRKPGSKLSEASKMLRRLEKGLNNAKLKSLATESTVLTSQTDSSQYQPALGARHPSFNTQPDHAYHPQASGASSLDEDDDGEPNEEGMYPAKLIKKEKQRNSFFGTVLGPSGSSRSPVEHAYSPVSSSTAERGTYSSEPSPSISLHVPFGHLDDPVQAGLMDDQTAEHIMDLVFIRLNPFVNLFDPELHSSIYIRKRSPFLFSTLLMAGSKFFKPQLYQKCRELAEQHAIKAFAEAQKSVEVVQAFMCLTYWGEPNSNRTWTYIGYACRMAVELGLNRYTPRPPESETAIQRLERRNRERTYLVLFVHDRSLSMQTGRLWMLPEDELVLESYSWHEQVPPGTPIRPEDVIVSAFVALRLIATETTKMFELQKGSMNNGQPDNYDFLLNACNSKLSGWATTWSIEMKRAHGESFHHSFLEFFQLYVGLFLNSFGIHAYMTNTAGPSPSLQALGTCYSNASRCLEIVVKEFARVQMLQYSQESITVMTAYCAVMLLRLLRKTNLKTDEGSGPNILTLILSASDAYREAGTMMPSSSSCAAHARFLRTLVEREEMKARQMSRERMDNIDPALQTSVKYPAFEAHSHVSAGSSPSEQLGANRSLDAVEDGYSYHTYPQTEAALVSPESGKETNGLPNGDAFHGSFPSQSHADHLYYDNMCRELGVTQGVDLIQGPPAFYPRMAPSEPYPMMGQ
ncbi:hypothetical protein ACEPAI_4962 [Sanghuangporus weigelae]